MGPWHGTGAAGAVRVERPCARNVRERYAT
jgi:hypothetical protein